eukprot:ANDGO_00306.mRNA.1 hypothetical protein DICPUDRAFT_154027
MSTGGMGNGESPSPFLRYRVARHELRPNYADPRHKIHAADLQSHGVSHSASMPAFKQFSDSSAEFSSIRRDGIDALSALRLWELPPGDGVEYCLDFTSDRDGFNSAYPPRQPKHLLGQLTSTAICGNDITSSCLYTAAFVAQAAGVYSVFSLLAVAFVLYFYRFVYEEVGSALPLNGGSYTILLNTTQKWFSAVASACSFLSYVATAVVSGATAISYGAGLWGSGPDETALIVALLGFFCVLTLLGLEESAGVAVVIFVIHMVSLFALILASFVYMCMHPSVLSTNWAASDAVPSQYSVAQGLFVGFGAGMLGITGFETSCNFLEEQKPGVFPKTLRNMWWAVAFFNPMISFLSFAVLTNAEVEAASNALLAQMALRTTDGNTVLFYLISVDAFMVLSGAVLTGYVGVVGLLARMAEDRCIPKIMAAKNPYTGSRVVSIIVFFLICTSMLYIVGGAKNVTILEGVYAVAFLSVMSFVAVGNMILKYNRSYIPCERRCSLPTVLFAFCGSVSALLISVIVTPSFLWYFLLYLAACLAFLFFMFQKVRILRIARFVILASIRALREWKIMFRHQSQTEFENLCNRTDVIMHNRILHICNQPVVLFTRLVDTHTLFKLMRYVYENEQCYHVYFVHMFQYEGDPEHHSVVRERMESLRCAVEFLEKCFPKYQLDLVFVNSNFTSQAVEAVSKTLSVPKNLMFISCPGLHRDSSVRISDFAGLRIVTA